MVSKYLYLKKKNAALLNLGNDWNVVKYDRANSLSHAVFIYNYYYLLFTIFNIIFCQEIDIFHSRLRYKFKNEKYLIFYFWFEYLPVSSMLISITYVIQ